MTPRPAWTRRLLLGSLPAALAACADDAPPRTSFPPLRYDYLTPLRLNVAAVEIRDEVPPGAASDIPLAVSPRDALRGMAEDRLVASGSAGRAVFVIEQAAVTRVRGGLSGQMSVHLDVLNAGGDKAGYAEARVNRLFTGNARDPRGAAYDLVSQMMSAMNIELEFQVRRSLRDALQQTAPNAPTPGPVQQQDLAPPPGRGVSRPAPEPAPAPEPDLSI